MWKWSVRGCFSIRFAITWESGITITTRTLFGVELMPVITCVDDLKRIYKRRTPRMFYDYAESGSWTEQTFRENTTDFQDIHLRQRVAIDMSGRTTKSQMIGQDVSMPVALAPVGLTGMQCADGEIKAARAAEKFGVPYTLSTMSICSIEKGKLWRIRERVQ
eukprot:TRINITY_DN1975_c0_g1_i2.p1 TRINITY_DN1975_c0_g1~~TRINITY_DN1975_c0_g1_i2.p1  ORF type:complete len:162 (+),score=7.51 TRINITY_DN1975_c0_g1_i2:468-953(+)